LPLEYLRDPEYASSAFDIRLEASIQGPGMLRPETVTRYFVFFITLKPRVE